MFRISRIGVISFAKIAGLSGALMGLIVGLMYGVGILFVSLIGGAAAAADPNVGNAGWGLAGMGLLGAVIVIIAVPLLYGVMSFIFGLIYGLIINLVLGWAGGLELQIDKI